jgi:hypothetical protein
MPRSQSQSSGSLVAASPRRTNTGEALSDPTYRVVQWYRCKRRPLYWIRIKSYQVSHLLRDKCNTYIANTLQVPHYLHHKITRLRSNPSDSDLVHGLVPRLKQFHKFLSTVWDSKGLLEECVWAASSDTSTCSYSELDSVAQNLDTFQRVLCTDAEFTICAINVNAGSGFESFVPWHVSITNMPATQFRGLLEVIIQGRWTDSYKRIIEQISQLEDRHSPQLTWSPNLPSAVYSHETLPHKEPTMHGVSITLEWLREPAKVERFSGSLDWSIYISEPYNQRPSLDALQIVDVTVEGSKYCRIAILTTSGDVLKRLKQGYDDSPSITCVATSSLSMAEDRILDTLLRCLMIIIADVTHYIKESVKVVQDMVCILASESQVHFTNFTIVGIGITT